MTKRRLTLNDTVNNLNKRRNLINRVVGVQEAIQVLVDYFDTKHDSSHGEQVILQSTTALECLEEATCALLVARARARGNQGKLSGAISDALEAINHDPTSAEAYLAAGQLYSMQGKQQKAVDIFERGLCRVLPRECPFLYDEREKAKLLSERRVDFVASLPAEITVTVFERLYDSMIKDGNKEFNDGENNDMDNNHYINDSSNYISITVETTKLISSRHITCTYVSKRWREFILQQCPSLWRTAKVGRWNDVSPHERFVPSASRSVQNLILSDEADEQTFEKIVDMAGKDMFLCVRQLVLQFDSWDESTKERLMLMVITLLRRHLTKLSIKPALAAFIEDDMREDQNTFPLAMILSLCTCLEQLYIGSGLVFRYVPLQSSASYNLTCLAVEVSRGMSGLEQLIPRCPQLRYLSINGHSSRMLAILEEYCPQLQYLHVDHDPHLPTKDLCPDHHDDENYEKMRKLSTTENMAFGGLYEVHYDVPNLRALQQLVSFFVKSADTLKTLILTIDANDGQSISSSNRTDQQIHPNFGHVGFSRLKLLKLHVIQDTGGQLAVATASMIAKCSVLEHVQLCFPHSPVPDRFFTSLSNQSKLSRLIFREIDFPTTGAAQLFADRSKQSKKGSSWLRLVSIKRCRGVTFEVLNAIADILSLNTIQLGFSASNVSSEELLTVVRKLRTLPSLKIIMFAHLPHTMNDRIILQLAAFDGLKSLTLDDLTDITDRGIRQVIEQTDSLEHVDIFDCPRISQEMLSSIRKKFTCTFQQVQSGIM